MLAEVTRGSSAASAPISQAPKLSPQSQFRSIFTKPPEMLWTVAYCTTPDAPAQSLKDDILCHSTENRSGAPILGEPRTQDDMRTQRTLFGDLITPRGILDPLHGGRAKQRHRERIFENARR